MNRKSRDILAELIAKAAIQKAHIRANPEPYLNEVSEELARARQCFEEIERAISPDIIYDFANDHALRPEDVHGQDHIKIGAVYSALDKYYRR